jgi:hypothetical protein
VPGWHEATKELQADGKIQLVGLIQEQHPDRCRLFMQWKQMDWPILVDPINLTGVSAVPIVWAIDEYGIVRARNPRRDSIEADFISKTYPAPTGAPAAPDHPAAGLSAPAGSAGQLRARGDVALLHRADLDGALATYKEAIAADPDDGSSRFRLGVALRMRYDSPDRQPDDFQAAVNAWTQALDRDPNQYIWRRRIQQYGPRLDKPYPFYDWVEQAREDLRARGEEPLPLSVEPRGAELASPRRSLETTEGLPHPDPDGKITRDPGANGGFMDVETVVVPGTVEAGKALRVHLVFRTRPGAHWNNEAEPLRVWLKLPEGWRSDPAVAQVATGDQAISDEVRRVEFEIVVPDGQAAGAMKLQAEAFYNVCHDDGICLFRRNDIAVSVPVRGPSGK